MLQDLWFFGFWGLFVLLAFLECRLSRDNLDLDRWTRWPINLGFAMVNGVLFSLLPIGTVLAAQWAATHGIGLFHASGLPSWLHVAASVLVPSLGQYAFHRIAHSTPALWALHRVHHSDMQPDVSTQFRIHPLELVANLLFLVPWVVAMGLDPMTLAVFQMVELALGVASHSSLALPAAAERSLRTLIVTPGLHRLHHSNFAFETDTNFGGVFSFWDRLFGTYLGDKIRAQEAFEFGLTDIDREHANDFAWLLASPWLAMRSGTAES